MEPRSKERALHRRIGSGAISLAVLVTIVVLFAFVISRGALFGLGG